NILVARLPLPRGRYDTAAEKQQFYRPLLARLQALPGVMSVTTVSSLPGFGGARAEVDIPSHTHTERWDAILSLCSEGYFQTAGSRLLRGRLLNETDVNGARKVIVVSQEFVKRYLGETDPIGQLVKFKRFVPPPDDPAFEIVGVVADTKNVGPLQPTTPE